MFCSYEIVSDMRLNTCEVITQANIIFFLFIYAGKVISCWMNEGHRCPLLKPEHNRTSLRESVPAREVMATNTRGRRSYQERYNSAEQRQDNGRTQVQGDVSGRRAVGVDQPFPNKPVQHRRSLNPRMHGSLALHDFEKISISARSRGPLSTHDHPNEIRETTKSQHSMGDFNSLTKREVQMAKAIHAKELMLQEKLWRVEEKVRQKMQTKDQSVQKLEEDMHNRRQRDGVKAETKIRPREPVTNREMLKHDRRHDDVEKLRKKENLRHEDRKGSTREEQGARCREVEDVQSPQLKREENKVIHESKVHVHKVRREVDRRKGEVGRAETRQQVKAAADIDISTSQKIYKDKKGVNGSCDDDVREEDMTMKSQQKTVHPISNRQQQGAHRQTYNSLTSLELLTCRICNRKFSQDRVEKHMQVCERVKQSQRRVFNSYFQRTKGSALEEFQKTHGRNRTPEVCQ